MDKGQLIKLKRNSLGLSQKQMAMLLQLNETGERTVRGWENNEHEPSDEVLIKLENLKMDFPYSRKEFHNGLKIIDLFFLGKARSGRLLSSALGLPPGQPVMVFCIRLNILMLRS